VSSPRNLVCRGSVLVFVVSLSSCGGGGTSDPVAVRVGRATITRVAVDHWISAISAGRTPSDLTGRRYRELKRQALDLLISSQWVIGEAVGRRLALSDHEVQRRVAEKRAASFGGEVEFHDFLKATGQTLVDVELQAKAELASSKLTEMAMKNAGAVTQNQIASYYDKQRWRFTAPEVREVMITNRKTNAAANELRLEVESGANFMTKSERALVSFSSDTSANRMTPLERAIRAAKPNVLTGPFKQRVDYFVFKVKKIVPASSRPLAQVERSIKTRLVDERRRRALGEFVKKWRTRWLRRTDCYPGYVVQKCSQYNGPMVPEDQLNFK
jgi:hypothetical protein